MTDQWRNRITGHGEVAPEQLLANPRNWHIHQKAQQDALAAVLDQVGWVQDVIVNQRTGHVVDGHARIALAISREEASISVVYVDLDEDEERLLLASLDPLSAMATTDADAMRELLAEITVDDAALLAMFEQIAPRLQCGDSTEAADIEWLMDGSLADLVWTDPPYGVAVASRVGTRARSSAEARAEGGAGIRNDEVDVEALTTMLRSSIGLALRCTRPGAAWYVTAPHGPIGLAFSVVLADLGVWRHSLVWVKDSLVLSRMDYHYRHEPIYYGWTPGAPRRLQVWLDVGEQDPWLETVTGFDRELTDLGVAHEFHVYPGPHDDEYWTENLGAYLELYSRALVHDPTGD